MGIKAASPSLIKINDFWSVFERLNKTIIDVLDCFNAYWKYGVCLKGLMPTNTSLAS